MTATQGYGGKRVGGENEQLREPHVDYGFAWISFLFVLFVFLRRSFLRGTTPAMAAFRIVRIICLGMFFHVKSFILITD